MSGVLVLSMSKESESNSFNNAFMAKNLADSSDQSEKARKKRMRPIQKENAF